MAVVQIKTKITNIYQYFGLIFLNRMTEIEELM